MPFLMYKQLKALKHETQEIDILMDWTPQNSPNRNLVLSEMSSSASSTTRFSEVMTIETSKKRYPSSSTSSAPEKVDAMRNLDADLFKMRSPALSTNFNCCS
ncbi:hypothetical protein JTB14_035993 [Gonioctena quinquepunctata]|nr:hypothetical protein JTB14_035993 [Gonioctena quinquepunctata]